MNSKQIAELSSVQMEELKKKPRSLDQLKFDAEKSLSEYYEKFYKRVDGAAHDTDPFLLPDISNFIESALTKAFDAGFRDGKGESSTDTIRYLTDKANAYTKGRGFLSFDLDPVSAAHVDEMQDTVNYLLTRPTGTQGASNV